VSRVFLSHSSRDSRQAAARPVGQTLAAAVSAFMRLYTPCEAAFQAAQRGHRRVTHFDALAVVQLAGSVAQLCHGDAVQCGVDLAVARLDVAHPPLGASRPRRGGCDAGEPGERCLGGKPRHTGSSAMILAADSGPQPGITSRVGASRRTSPRMRFSSSSAFSDRRVMSASSSRASARQPCRAGFQATWRWLRGGLCTSALTEPW
jgi:hypothetical protein